MAKKESGCSFCGRQKNEVQMLITGVSGHICENCVEQANTIISEEQNNLKKEFKKRCKHLKTNRN